MQASISIKGMDRQLERLDPKNAEDILVFGLERIHDKFENRVGLEADQTVYSYKPAVPVVYKRTGRLLGGRGKANGGGKPRSKRVDYFTYMVEANPELKGASFDYAPWVNVGKGWMRHVGARPFWDNATKWANVQGRRATLKEMSKKIKDL